MISAVLLKTILLSLLCLLPFKIPVLLYLNSLDPPQKTGEKLTVTSFIMFLKNQILVIELNAFNAQKYFVGKPKYQIWIGSLKHVSALLGILYVSIAKRTTKIVSQ